MNKGALSHKKPRTQFKVMETRGRQGDSGNGLGLQGVTKDKPQHSGAKDLMLTQCLLQFLVSQADPMVAPPVFFWARVQAKPSSPTCCIPHHWGPYTHPCEDPRASSSANGYYWGLDVSRPAVLSAISGQTGRGPLRPWRDLGQ